MCGVYVWGGRRYNSFFSITYVIIKIRQKFNHAWISVPNSLSLEAKRITCINCPARFFFYHKLQDNITCRDSDDGYVPICLKNLGQVSLESELVVLKYDSLAQMFQTKTACIRISQKQILQATLGHYPFFPPDNMQRSTSWRYSGIRKQILLHTVFCTVAIEQ